MRARWRHLVLVGTLVAASCSSGDDSGSERAERTEPTQPAFPGDDWAQGDPDELGFDPAALEAIATDAHASGAQCFLVVRRGRIAGEWYWDGTDAATPHNVFSITKSYTSTLVGIAQDEGLLDVDDPASAYIPAWVGTPSEDVTVRQMLGMVSGRDPISVVDEDQRAAYFGAPDLTAYALDREQTRPPGTWWAVNEADVQPLGLVLETATGQAPAAYAAAKLFGPIGDRRTTLAEDQAGNTIMDAFAQATCRDVARLGHLFANSGRWDGTQVVSPAWVEDATAHQSQDVYANYGLLWWLNRPGRTQPDQVDRESLGPRDPDRDQLVPGAPEDLYWALGAYGQVLQVHPGSGTVVVRLGMNQDFISMPALDSTTRVVTEALAG